MYKVVLGRVFVLLYEGLYTSSENYIIFAYFFLDSDCQFYQ